MTTSEPVDILLVEDTRDERELALRALKKGPAANVLAVEDGKEALDFMFSRGEYAYRRDGTLPRLVILDLKLPKVNGLEVLREIKSNAETEMIPVVILTSSQEDRDIVQSYRHGANSYLVKPVDFAKFVQCVSKIPDYWLTCNRIPR